MPQRWGHIGGIRKHWLTGQQNFKSKTTVPLSFCLNSLSHTHTHFPTLHLYTPPQPTTITNHLILLLLHAFSLKKKEGVPVWTDVEISAVCQWIITFPGSLCILICLTVYRVYPFEYMRDTFHSFLQPQDLVARILFFFFLREYFWTNFQTGDTSGHRLLGSVDPGSAVRFGWLGTLWVRHLPLFPLLSCLFAFNPSYAYVSYENIMVSFFLTVALQFLDICEHDYL